MLLSYSISGRLLLNLCIMSHRGNHLSVLYDKIPVFYALKYPKFTTITFYPSAWRPNPLLTSANCTTSSWPYAHFNVIFTHVTITTKISGTNMKVFRVFGIRSSEKKLTFSLTLIRLDFLREALQVSLNARQQLLFPAFIMVWSLIGN